MHLNTIRWGIYLGNDWDDDDSGAKDKDPTLELTCVDSQTSPEGSQEDPLPTPSFPTQQGQGPRLPAERSKSHREAERIDAHQEAKNEASTPGI